MGITNDCYEQSIALLIANSSEFGFLASGRQARAEERNYLSVFARDASICSLGAIASGNAKLIATAKKSIKTLAKFQAENGQIPNYVKPENKYVDFWRMGCIDASLWWLIALDFYDRNTLDKDLKRSLTPKIAKTLNWLKAQEHPTSRLLIQNEASDWADLFPRSGKVLYSNSLWLKVKHGYKLKDYELSLTGFTNAFYPFAVKPEKFARSEKRTAIRIIESVKKTDYFLSFINYLFWGDDADVYGNSLALIFLLPKKELKNRITEYFLTQKRIPDLPLPVLFHPIQKKSSSWRKYMESHKQNFPFQYHNGGIWPFAACFWAMALSASGKKKEAEAELERIAHANSLNNWEFKEWFHAKTGKPMGMKGQSWNAGAYLLAYKALSDKKKIIL